MEVRKRGQFLTNPMRRTGYPRLAPSVFHFYTSAYMAPHLFKQRKHGPGRVLVQNAGHGRAQIIPDMIPELIQRIINIANDKFPRSEWWVAWSDICDSFGITDPIKAYGNFELDDTYTNGEGI